MSLPTVTGTARLLCDPSRRATKDNRPMASVLVKFQGWRRDGERWVEGDAVVASVVAFDDTARTLAGFVKGDEVTISGQCTVQVWKDQPQLRIVASTVEEPARAPKQRDGREKRRTEAMQRLQRAHHGQC